MTFDVKELRGLVGDCNDAMIDILATYGTESNECKKLLKRVSDLVVYVGILEKSMQN